MDRYINAGRLKEWFRVRNKDLFSVETICAVIDVMAEEDSFHSEDEDTETEASSNNVRARSEYTEITDRVQKEDNMNKVYFIDEKGPGGGYHDYMIVNGRTGFLLADITFQKGPRKDEKSVQGVLDTDLLEIVRHRLRAFCDGEMADERTKAALCYVVYALDALKERTENRKRRGVLGTMEK